MSKHKDTLCGIIGIVLAVVLFVGGASIAQKEANLIGAGFLPQIAAVLTFFLSCSLTVSGIQKSKTYQKKTPPFLANRKGILIICGAMLVYCLLLKPVGFVITSILFLFLCICVMTPKEKTNYLKFAIISVVAVVLIYLVFTQVFGVRIPSGIL